MSTKNSKIATAGFAARLREVIEEAHNPSAYAEACGLSPSLVQSYSQGSQPGLENLIKLANGAAVTVEWLATGRGPKHPSDIDTETFALIQRMNIQANAGHGTVAEDQAPYGSLAFRRDWLRQLGVSALDAWIINADGDSMEPTIRAGDSLLIDLSDNARKPRDGIFIIRSGELLQVKRLQWRPGGRVAVTSDNPAYKPFEIKAQQDPETAVVGRVVWVGKRV